MSSVIPYLIERELLSNRQVELPGVGVLWLERNGAVFSENRQSMIPPQDRLMFSDQGRGSVEFYGVISSYLQQESNIGGYFDDDEFEHKAYTLYEEWYNGALSYDMMGVAILSIEGVCDISLGDRVYLLGVSDVFLGFLCTDSSYYSVGMPGHSSAFSTPSMPSPSVERRGRGGGAKTPPNKGKSSSFVPIYRVSTLGIWFGALFLLFSALCILWWFLGK